jgi:exopolyphosphatase / guanosine-5'-triphosphate,3'-diphosphate pyrophosphatase
VPAGGKELKIERGILRGTEIINAIMGIGEAHGFEAGHALQVTKLALRLFDELQPLHDMGNTERIWLRAAAMLHDVGKARDPKNHHKVAQEIIIRSARLPFRIEERAIVGLVARYHRGSLPRNDHKYFEDLDGDGRRYVRRLAALLRLADGLDKGHASLVESLECDIRRRRLLIQVVSRSALNLSSALSKADLFNDVFRKNVVIRVAVARPRPDSTLDLDTGLAYADTN